MGADGSKIVGGRRESWRCGLKKRITCNSGLGRVEISKGGLVCSLIPRRLGGCNGVQMCVYAFGEVPNLHKWLGGCTTTIIVNNNCSRTSHLSQTIAVDDLPAAKAIDIPWRDVSFHRYAVTHGAAELRNVFRMSDSACQYYPAPLRNTCASHSCDDNIRCAQLELLLTIARPV